MMQPRRILLGLAALLTLVLAPAMPARAEVGGLHVNITPYGGYGVWAKEVNLANRGMYGVRAGVGFGRYVGVEGSYGWMKTHTVYGDGDSLFTANSQSALSQQSVHLYGVDLVLNLVPKSGLDPYVLGGWHEEKFKTSDASQQSFMNGPEIGGGFKVHLSRKAALRFELRDKMWKFDSPPAPQPPGDKRLHNLFYSGGIQFTIGGSPHDGDADHDGVKDSQDKCPDTPPGALVDANGCPLDSDGDGVFDGLDQCPNTPRGATVDAKGCPTDSDNDGVFDGLDQCPGTPAGVKVDAHGCPLVVDTDGDGVPDNLDQCSNTPAGVQVDAHGCPLVIDSDHDGVPDDKDLCPNTPQGVKVDSDGCPIELTVRERELLDKGTITTREIHFATAKWDILPESQPVLDDIGSILIQWPRLRIEVGGHCDARGSNAYNLDLSQKRAEAVLDYLERKFPQIAHDQYAAKGYGESVPVASNRTIEGMAKNRRVEFKVLNVEELTKERTRRHLLKKGE